MEDKEIIRLQQLQIEKTDAHVKATAAFTQELVGLSLKFDQFLNNSVDQTELSREILRKFDNGIKTFIKNTIDETVGKHMESLGKALVENTDAVKKANERNTQRWVSIAALASFQGLLLVLLYQFGDKIQILIDLVKALP